MPIIATEERKRFTWLEVDGLPVGEVKTIAGHQIMPVCPLCGCAHHLIGKPGSIYAPACVLAVLATMPRTIGQPGNWKAIYADWLSQHPQAKQHNAVLLLDRTAYKRQKAAAARERRKARKQKAAA